MIEAGILFATLTLIGYGVSPVFSKQAVKFHDPQSISIFVHVVGTLIIFMFLGSSLDLSFFSSPILWLMLIAGVIGATNVFMLYQAIIRAPISIVTPLVSTNHIFLILISIYFFGETLTFWKWIGIAVTILGGYMVIADYRKLRHIKEKNVEWKGVLFSLVCSSLFVVYNTSSKVITNRIGGANTTVAMEFLVLFFMILIMVVFRYRFSIPRKIGLVYTSASALFFALGAGFFYVSIESAGLALTTGIVAGAPAISAVGGRLFLKEKLGLQKNLGVALVIIGILAVQLL